MFLAHHTSADAQRVWLEKWTPVDCCPELQDNDGWTVAAYLARHASADVQRVWLEKWSPAECCPGLQDTDGLTVANVLAYHESALVQRWCLETSARGYELHEQLDWMHLAARLRPAS